MIPVSIVIIAKNEADSIAGCIEMAQLITDDIVIVDNGSTDDTLKIVQQYGCRLYHETWDGYGANKNKGSIHALYNWILSLDADEIPDLELVKALHKLDFDDPEIVYNIKFRSYFGKKRIRFGNWARDHHVRLFNRTLVKWSESKVHEKLILPRQIKTKGLKGYLHHYSVKDAHECNHKALYYARLSTEEYLKNGKEATLLNLFISPVFSFLRGYILLLGFLDGKEGWNISRAIFKNKWLKYHCLIQKQSRKKKEFSKDNLTVEY